MGKGVVAAIVGVTGLGLATLGLAASIHYSQLHSEQRKIDNIPEVVQQTEQARVVVRDYLSDEFVTPEEDSDLYWICRTSFDSRTLRDSLYTTTREGRRITSGLFNMRHEFRPEQNIVTIVDKNGRAYDIEVRGKDVSGSDVGMRLDTLLGELAAYVQTPEYGNLVGPLSPKERFRRNAVAFLTD